MPRPKELTRDEVLDAARNFRWTRKMPKWTVLIGERELPARPLVLEAAGVPPNDPTNSHQAVEILKRLGFETRYAKEPKETERWGETAEREGEPGSVVDMVCSITKKVAEREWERIPGDLSKNVDHYLYGLKRTRK